MRLVGSGGMGVDVEERNHGKVTNEWEGRRKRTGHKQEECWEWRRGRGSRKELGRTRILNMTETSTSFDINPCDTNLSAFAISS